MKALLVRMSDEEYEQIKERADKLNLPLARYLSLKALDKLNEKH